MTHLYRYHLYKFIILNDNNNSADTEVRTATCPMPAAIPSGLYPLHALYQAAVHNPSETITDSNNNNKNQTQPQSVTPLTNHNIPVEIPHLIRNDVWIS